MTVLLKKFAISGDNVFPFKQTEGAVANAIPPGLYTIEESLFGYYLHRKAEKIELPSKIYGSTLSRAERCFKTYDRTAEPLTVGLFGSKGAGKTLLANVIAQQSIERGMPVIDVSDSFKVDRDYLAFIESLGPVTVLFDEFLKKLSNTDIPVDDDSKYNAKKERAGIAQDNMLTFLQGTGNSKRLTVLIDNKFDLLSDYIDGRPGRMRYRYHYDAIEPAVVEAVGKDAGLNDAQVEQLVVYTQTTQTTFDVLRVIVQEWTFYPDVPLSEITDVLNVPAVRSYEPDTYDVKFLDIPEGSEYRTLDDVEGIADGKSIRVTIERINKHIDEPELNKDDYYESDISGFGGYDDYKRNRLNPYLQHTLVLHSRNLIGYSGTKRKYAVDGLTLEVEPKASKRVRPMRGYYDFSDPDFM